jgi:hypothetical protein
MESFIICTLRPILLVLLTEEDTMGKKCVTHAKSEKCRQNFGLKSVGQQRKHAELKQIVENCC